jgi:HAD superfamily phosphatase (TIGR01668 family)
MSLLYPTLFKNRITDITPSDLHSLHVRGVLLDVDNTLTTHGSQALDPAVQQWIEQMQAEGFVLTVVSNAPPQRVRPFAARIGLKYISIACKPLPAGFLRAAHRLGLPKDQCVAIGDQTFTDILGANLGGISSIQLMPIEKESHKPFMSFKRFLERDVLKRYQHAMEKHGKMR